MNYFRLTATLQAPLAIQQERQSHAPVSLDYLPGSSLRGALASLFLRQGGNPQDHQFRTLFLDVPPCFPCLYPADDETTIPRVLPFTAMSCKRRSGFRNEQDAHGVLDALAVIAGNRILNAMADENFWTCQCHQDLKPYSGYWNGDVGDPKKYESTKLFRRHTGIDRHTGTVAQGIFYSTQAIGDYRHNEAAEFSPQYLSGGIFLTDSQKDILAELISQGPLFVGADRARGYGEIKLGLHPALPPAFAVSSWSESFKRRFQEVMGQAPPDQIYVSISLQSPAILLDQFLRPTAELNLNFTGLTPVLKVTKAHRVRGWQASWGLPKADDLALAAGSVFLYSYEGDGFDGLENYLDELVKSGVGCRTSEGLGSLSICDPIHVEDII